MNIYLISQKENVGYDTYDEAVVCAPNEAAARLINPDGEEWGDTSSGWCSSPDKVTVKMIGQAAPSMEHGVVCSSFNAG
jgi:hypothetical protein